MSTNTPWLVICTGKRGRRVIRCRHRTVTGAAYCLQMAGGGWIELWSPHRSGMTANAAPGQCAFCGAVLTGQRRVKCGSEECRRAYMREYWARGYVRRRKS